MADEKTTPKAAERGTTPTPAAEQKTSQASQRQVPTGADMDRVRRFSNGGVTEAQAEELDRLGVNPALDNRTGNQRPRKVEWPAKPQQVPGSVEVGHFEEHAEKTRHLAEKFGPGDGEVLGMRSEGRHGLGDDEGDKVGNA